MAHWSTVLEFVPNTLRADLPPGAFSIGTFVPDLVDIDEVSGGFNCVVQISSEQCLRTFHQCVFPAAFDFDLPSSQLVAFFGADAAPFSSALLNALRNESQVPGAYRVKATPVPLRLRFVGGRVIVTYEVELSIERVMTSVSGIGRVRTTAAPSIAVPIGTRVGSLWISIDASYGDTRIDEIAFVDILASLSGAKVAIESSGGDVDRLLAGMPGLNGLDLVAYIRGKGDTRLTIPLSLVGGDIPGNAWPVTEFESFDISVFACESGVQQALTVAFDVQKGCKGVIESVKHFIGPYDYGVVSDEYVLQQSVRYRHKMGDLPAVIPAGGMLTMEDADQNPIGARLFGSIGVTTFESLGIAFDANAGAEVVRLGGIGKLGAITILLDNGLQLQDSDLPLPADRSLDWAVTVRPDLVETPVSQPELTSFQRQMTDRVFRHLGKPFALVDDPDPLYRWPTPTVDYCRFSSFPASMYCLGTIPNAVIVLAVGLISIG